MITPEQKARIRERAGLTPVAPSSATNDRLARFKAATAPVAAPKMTLPTNMGGQIDIGMYKKSDEPNRTSSIIADEVQKSANEVVSTFDRAEGPLENVAAALTVPLKAAGTAIRAAGRAVAEPLVPIVEKIGKPIVDKIEEAVPGFAEEVANNVTGGVKFLEDNADIIRQKVGDDVYNSVRDTIEVLTAGIGGGAAKQPVKQLLNVAQETGDVVVKNVDNVVAGAVDNVTEMFKPTQQSIDNYVLENFEKSVKPTIAGKSGSAGQMDAYRSKAVDAVNTITENKPNLKFKNADGEDIIGRTPETMQEFAESIDQTKKSVFDKYDALAKQAGSAGGEVGGENIVKELDVVKNNKALAITNPEAVKYADDVQKRLSEFDADGNFIGYKKFDTNTAQDIIKNYNNSLEAFYRNPTYDNASRAAIDAGVVNNFRKELDSVIEGLTGEEYQALKNQYASLKAIEKDVVKRANILARQNNKSLLDYSDIFSGGEMVTGILTLNPAMFAKGAAQRGIKEWFKYLNSPNRAVKKMFEAAERAPSSMAKPNMQAGAINFGAELTPRTKLKLPPEVKDNIVKIIDDYRLNKGKDLTLQEDAARIAEDLNLPKSKNYAQLVNMLEDLLSKQKDDVRKVIVKK